MEWELAKPVVAPDLQGACAGPIGETLFLHPERASPGLRVRGLDQPGRDRLARCSVLCSGDALVMCGEEGLSWSRRGEGRMEGREEGEGKEESPGKLSVGAELEYGSPHNCLSFRILTLLLDLSSLLLALRELPGGPLRPRALEWWGGGRRGGARALLEAPTKF